jgi:hypothetical protein
MSPTGIDALDALLDSVDSCTPLYWSDNNDDDDEVDATLLLSEVLLEVDEDAAFILPQVLLEGEEDAEKSFRETLSHGVDEDAALSFPQTLFEGDGDAGPGTSDDTEASSTERDATYNIGEDLTHRLPMMTEVEDFEDDEEEFLSEDEGLVPSTVSSEWIGNFYDLLHDTSFELGHLLNWTNCGRGFTVQNDIVKRGHVRQFRRDLEEIYGFTKKVQFSGDYVYTAEGLSISMTRDEFVELAGQLKQAKEKFSDVAWHQQGMVVRHVSGVMGHVSKSIGKWVYVKSKGALGSVRCSRKYLSPSNEEEFEAAPDAMLKPKLDPSAARAPSYEEGTIVRHVKSGAVGRISGMHRGAWLYVSYDKEGASDPVPTRSKELAPASEEELNTFSGPPPQTLAEKKTAASGWCCKNNMLVQHTLTGGIGRVSAIINSWIHVVLNGASESTPFRARDLVPVASSSEKSLVAATSSSEKIADAAPFSNEKRDDAASLSSSEKSTDAAESSSEKNADDVASLSIERADNAASLFGKSKSCYAWCQKGVLVRDSSIYSMVGRVHK